MSVRVRLLARDAGGPTCRRRDAYEASWLRTGTAPPLAPYAKNQWRANQRRQGSLSGWQDFESQPREGNLRGTGRRKDPGYTPAELCA